MRRCAHWPRGPPQLIIAGASAYRVIDFARASASGRRFRRRVPDGDMAHRRPGRCRRAQARAVCRRRHPHDAQRRCAARAVRSSSAATELARSALFSRHAGRPLMHVIAGKAVCFSSAAASLPHLSAAGVQNAAVLAPRFLLAGRHPSDAPAARMKSSHAAGRFQPRRTGAQMQGICSTQRLSPPTRTPSRTRRSPCASRNGLRLGTPATTRSMGGRRCAPDQRAHLPSGR